MYDLDNFDLENGWKLVAITSPGYSGWCNLIHTDPSNPARPAMLSPEAASMIRELFCQKVV